MNNAAAADITCYIQPAKFVGQFAVSDVSKTAVIRKTVGNRSEAEAVLSEATQWAAQIGGRVCIKTVIHTNALADRAPAKVKRLAGIRWIG